MSAKFPQNSDTSDEPEIRERGRSTLGQEVRSYRIEH